MSAATVGIAHVQFPLADIKVAGENDKLYAQFDPNNTDDEALIDDICEDGVREPVVISKDGVLLSGHRRVAASRFIGIGVIPARFEDVVFEDLDEAERKHLLASYNLQRVKSPAERIREAAALVNDNDVAEVLFRQPESVDAADLHEIELGAEKRRAKITTIQFRDAAKSAVMAAEKNWPISVRYIHYTMLNDPPLMHDSKPNSHYQNNEKSSRALSNLLTRMRLNDDIPMRAICDETRPVAQWASEHDVGTFFDRHLRSFLSSYAYDYLAHQPCHVEIVCEKLTMKTVVDRVASQYRIPTTVSRGKCSLPPRDGIARRYKASMKGRCIILVLSDHDPDGEVVAESLCRCLRDEQGIRNVRAIRVALHPKQIERLDLPSAIDAKPSAPTYKSWVKKYGSTRAVELDAMPFDVVEAELRAAIEGVLDLEILEQSKEKEMRNAHAISAIKKYVVEQLGDLDIEEFFDEEAQS